MKFEDRQLVPSFNKSGFGLHKYLYRAIRSIDLQRNSVKMDMSLTFFSQELNPIHAAGDIIHPILCAFKDGSFTVLPVGFYGDFASTYLGPRYAILTAWAILPLPESKLNPGNDYQYANFYTQTNSIGDVCFRELVVLDYHFIWQNKLAGASAFNSSLASLWKKGYDTITSLVSKLTTSLNSSIMNSESLNCSNIPDITSPNTSPDTKKS